MLARGYPPRPPLTRQCCQGLVVIRGRDGRYYKYVIGFALCSCEELWVMDDLAFSASVLKRLPLADSVWRVLHFIMDDVWLDDVWQRERGRCYEQTLKFSTLARLIADALLEHDGSGRQAFERAQEAETLPVSIGSAYEKLGNLPLSLRNYLRTKFRPVSYMVV